MPDRTNVEYVAPPREMVEKYTRAVCRELKKIQGKHWEQESYVNAFSQFVKSVIEIERKRRNSEAKSDE